MRYKGVDVAKNLALIRDVHEVVRMRYDNDLSLRLSEFERSDLLCGIRIHRRYK